MICGEIENIRKDKMIDLLIERGKWDKHVL